MPPVTPYSPYLEGREPVSAMRETVGRIRSVTADWTAEHFERTYGPGKWSARLILIHLAQTEFALGARVRMALTVRDYVAQPFDQDDWITLDETIRGAEAVEALSSMSRMNEALFVSLSPQRRETPFAHPEYGTISVDWVLHQLAGHQLHHLRQIEKIEAS